MVRLRCEVTYKKSLTKYKNIPMSKDINQHLYTGTYHEQNALRKRHLQLTWQQNDKGQPVWACECSQNSEEGKSPCSQESLQRAAGLETGS